MITLSTYPVYPDDPDDPTADLDGVLADGIESVRQRVRQRIQFLAGEWVFDANAGIPYLPQVLGNPQSLGLAQQTIVDGVRTVPDVVSVQGADLRRDNDTRVLHVTLDILTIYGQLQLQSPISVAGQVS